MGEEVDAFAGVELAESMGGGVFEGFDGPCGSFSDVSFEFGEGVLNGIEIGTVRRKVDQLGAAGFDGFSNAGNFVRREIVHDDDVAWPQRRCQHLFDPGTEAFSVHRSVEKHRRDEAVERESTYKGDRFPVPVGDCRFAALASRRPTSPTRHFCRKTAFVDEDQTLWVQFALTVEPGLASRLHIGALLLTGMRSLFLCVWSCLSRNFHTAVRTTVTARSSCKRVTNSSSVVSGAS